MKHLHELSPDKKTKLLAELDCGYEDFDMLKKQTGDLTRFLHGSRRMESKWHEVKPYLTSYDAIIPLVQKLHPTFNDRQKDTFMRRFMTADNYMMATPSQLCDAVLVATGKAIL